MRKTKEMMLNELYEWARKKMYGCNVEGFHIGEVIKEKFIKPFRINEKQIATHIGIPEEEFDKLLSGEIDLDIPTAKKLAKAFKTSLFFWLGLKMHYEQYRDKTNVGKIKPLMLIRKTTQQLNIEENEGKMSRNNRLLDVMEEFGIKKKDLAEITGVTPPQISYQFTKQNYDTELIVYVTGIYFLLNGKVSLNYLIDGTGEKFAKEWRVPKAIKKGVNRRILSAMKDKDVSLAVMARACKKSSGGIWQALKGKVDTPKIIYYSSCVKLTGVSYEYLLYGCERG